jgi:hypothetical protein
MAHAYITFPSDGPLDGNMLPLGFCGCGHWVHSNDLVLPCPSRKGKLLLIATVLISRHVLLLSISCCSRGSDTDC